MTDMNELYKEIIIELYRNPLNKKELEKPDAEAKDVNPACGDVVGIQITAGDGIIEDIGFQGYGCAISQSAASVLTEMVKGGRIEDAVKTNIDEVLKELHLESLRNNASRIKCAALSLKVLKVALYKYLGQHEDVDWKSVV